MPLQTQPNFNEPGRRYFRDFSPGDDFYEALIDAHLAARLIDEFRRLSQTNDQGANLEQLTVGEMDVLRLVAEGADNQQIAQQLNLSAQTVANRLRVIYQKLQVNNRTQAVLYALRRGWVDLDREA